MSSKLSALPSAGTLLGGDLLYVARGGVSYQTTLDDVQSAIGGQFNGVVQFYADLPVDGSAAVGEIWLVRESTGTWLINRKQRGLYQRVDTTGVRATDWQYLGEWLEEFSDANFALYNSSDNTKGMKFSLTGITTGQTRTLTVPDASGTLLISTVAVTVPQGGTGRTTGTTAYGLIAAGTTATGAQQTLAAGATTEILVGGGASALPVWTTAQGSGAPVRATSPTLVTPVLGVATGTSLALTSTFSSSASGNISPSSTSSTSATFQSVTTDSGGTPKTAFWGVSGTGDSFFGSLTNNPVGLRVNNTTIAVVASTGVAVTGTFSAAGTAQIMGDFSSSASDPYIRFGNSGGTIQGFAQALTAGSIGFGSITNHPVVFRVNNAAVATLATTGLSVTGTTSSTGDITASAGRMLSGYNGSAGTLIRNLDDTSATQFITFHKADTTVIGSVSRVTTTSAVAYNTTSDGRLKTNVRDYTSADAGKIIDGLKPRWFDWKPSQLTEPYEADVVVDGKVAKVTKSRQVTDKAKLAAHAENNRSVIGFIAQEVAAVDPSLIKIGAVTVGDADPDVIGRQWQRSDIALVPILVAELKSLRARLSALETAPH